MQEFFILFRSIVNPDTDEFAVEAVTITADTCSDAIAVFHEQMRGCSFEIITVRPFVEPVL